MGDAVVVRDLSVVRGRRLVLPGLSLSVRTGSVTGLLGPSGSGKTTLLRAIVGVQVVGSRRCSSAGCSCPARTWPAWFARDVAVIAGAALLALALGAATLRRRTP